MLDLMLKVVQPKNSMSVLGEESKQKFAAYV